MQQGTAVIKLYLGISRDRVILAGYTHADFFRRFLS